MTTATYRTACRVQAHELLDRAKAGEDVPTGHIRLALYDTGDLDDDTVHLHTPVGAWEQSGVAGLAPANPFDGLVRS